MKRFVAFTGVLCHLLITGSMMEVVAAASLPAPEQKMEVVQELAMSPLFPMSPLNCDGCISIFKPIAHPNTDIAKKPCTGTCLMSHSPSVVGMTQTPQKDPAPVATLPVQTITIAFASIDQTKVTSHRYIAMRSPTETTVLRE